MVEFDLKTKDIDIRPNSVDENIEVVTNNGTNKKI